MKKCDQKTYECGCWFACEGGGGQLRCRAVDEAKYDVHPSQDTNIKVRAAYATGWQDGVKRMMTLMEGIGIQDDNNL